jgi:hypothetical protein
MPKEEQEQWLHIQSSDFKREKDRESQAVMEFGHRGNLEEVAALFPFSKASNPQHLRALLQR